MLPSRNILKNNNQIVIPASHYRKLFNDISGVIGYIPMNGNVGDQLIELATLGLMRKWKIPYQIITAKRLEKDRLPKHISHLYISGGGNMGGLYPGCRKIRRLACQKNIPVIVLPQTFTDAEENTNQFTQVWVREKNSLAICPGAKLAPDMAMSLSLDSRRSEARWRIGMYLREDKEGLFSDFSASFGDPVLLSSNLADYLELIVPYQHIVTDRLHFAIAALLMERRVTLLPNSYFKNRAMWETWLVKQNCLWADHPRSVDEIKTWRVAKKIGRADNLLFNNNCQIQRTPGWIDNGKRFTNYPENPEDKRSRGSRIRKPDRLVWQTLESPSSPPQLLNVLTSRFGITRFNRKQKLNSILRRLFSMGAIEIVPNDNRLVNSSQNPLGGRFHTPIEIDVSEPLRLGDDYYLFCSYRLKRHRIPIWYRVRCDDKHLIANVAETFLLSVLHIGMRSNRPVWIKGVPISRELLGNLQEYQSIWSLWHKRTYSVGTYARMVDSIKLPSYKKQRAIACFSGGVDSTFTLFNHTRSDENNYSKPLSDALLVHGFDIPIEDQYSFDSVEQKCRDIAADAGVNLITIATNVRELKLKWRQAHGALIAGAMHLVSRPFTAGLIPSTLNYGILFPWGSTPMTDPLLGCDSFNIVSDGASYTRIDKIQALKPWELAMEKIRFCNDPVLGQNCGECDKCTITAIMLLLVGASKSSIKPFPAAMRLAMQLQKTEITALDKSDLRGHLEIIAKYPGSPTWSRLLIQKLDRL